MGVPPPPPPPGPFPTTSPTLYHEPQGGSGERVNVSNRYNKQPATVVRVFTEVN